MPAMPASGSLAPDFTLTAADGSQISSADLRGKPLVLFFFPKASTPGWIIEARGFRDAIDRFRQCGAEVVGISTDRPRSQARFVEKQELSYPLLCDEDGEVCRVYGVRGKLGFARRVSFLIDAAGRVRKVYPRVSPAGHAEEVLADLQAIGGE